jgi:hypothetical protein
MIQINLLSDNIQAHPKPAGMTTRTQAIPLPDPDLDMDDQPRKSKVPLVLGLGALLVLGGGAAVFFTGEEPTEAAVVVPATQTAKPAAVEAKPTPVAKTDSVKPAATAPEAAKPEVKDAPKPEPRPEPKPEPKDPPKAAVVASVPTGPAVKAAALPPNALAEVLSQARPTSSASEKPNRFDALTPSGRTAYQKFAFERILAILRQVTPSDGVGFSKVRITSPGLLSIQGVATKPDALMAFQRGLAAQSMADTSTATGKDAAFALVARLPFNPSFGGSAAPATDVRKALQQALDLAAPQGLAFKASAARTETIGGGKRTSWTLTGQGGWDAVAAWLGGLQSAASPIGFTELTITAGDKGKLQVTVTAVCYGP